MNFFSYVVARDFGFAPNPFNGICTLATCKYVIRKQAKIGDWVLGTGSVALKCQNYLIYAKEVTEKLSYNEYWEDERFLCKKPVMNGSLKTMYGDNIYHHDDKQWLQEDSHHSLEDGTANYKTLNDDTRADAVLISSHFFYFGRECIEVPSEFLEKICLNRQGFRYVDSEVAKSFIKLIESNFSPGYYGDPIQFDSFKRYSGR